MSSRKVEDLMEFISKKDDENVKKCMRDILKEKVRERLEEEMNQK